MQKQSPGVVSLVRSISIGSPNQQNRFLVEYIPSNVVDVVLKSLNHVAQFGREHDDVLRCQSLDNAIIEAQAIGSRLLDDVKPQNLFFVFSESSQALAYMPLELPAAMHFTQGLQNRVSYTYKQQSTASQKQDSDSRAVVFCYVTDANLLRQFCGSEQQESHNERDCYQVAWCDLERIKRMLEEVSGHEPSVEQKAVAA